MNSAKILVLLLALIPGPVLACACCTNPGDYFSGKDRISEYERDEMKALQFARTATLYTTEADNEDSMKGLSHFAQSYALTVSRKGPSWMFALRDGKQAGTLTLTLPAMMEKFAVDPHASDNPGGLGPSLYKEWRLEGDATGTGIFAKSNGRNTRYFLVLQGQGLACDSADQFHHWRLEVRGDNAGYAFFGKLMQ